MVSPFTMTLSQYKDWDMDLDQRLVNVSVVQSHDSVFVLFFLNDCVNLVNQGLITCRYLCQWYCCARV